MSSPATSPNEIIRRYKRALAQAKGQKYADETQIKYQNGWFRVCHVDGTESNYRRQLVHFFTESLLEAAPDPAAYLKAVEKREAAKRELLDGSESFKTDGFNKRANGRNVVQMGQRAQIPAQQKASSRDSIVLVLIFGITVLCLLIWHDYEKKEEATRDARRLAEQLEREEKKKEANRKWEASSKFATNSYPVAPQTDPYAGRDFRSVIQDDRFWRDVEHELRRKGYK